MNFKWLDTCSESKLHSIPFEFTSKHSFSTPAHHFSVATLFRGSSARLNGRPARGFRPLSLSLSLSLSCWFRSWSTDEYIIMMSLLDLVFSFKVLSTAEMGSPSQNRRWKRRKKRAKCPENHRFLPMKARSIHLIHGHRSADRAYDSPISHHL